MKNKSWVDPSIYLKHIHVSEDILSLEYTQEMLHRANLPVTIVPSGENPANLNGEFAEELYRGKQHLFLCENKGNFFKPCPGTSEYRCCGYHVLNIGMNCPIDCVYCILQAYLNQPWITAFVNIDKLFDEVNSALENKPDRFFRIGTGEFTDSLALERITGISSKLIEIVGHHSNGILELKTKSGSIATLENCNHQGKTILSWSLNSPMIMKTQEIRSATLAERLDAAARAARWGYGLSFHFDPIIYHQGWREGYAETIDLLFKKVPREAIVWISLGALRFLPTLKIISTRRFHHSRIFHQEFIPGLDGKSRYFRTLREEMYTHIYTLLRAKAGVDTCVYFCMESDEIWDKVCGHLPDSKGGIAAMLDEAALRAIAKY
ncbi:SPL family radical SAM protein [Desulfopila inferna]|uniref:SPL family radical SAM protein n=1 Tax=Desulfopila inferna TaxID=468528 RepID=UPI0019656F4F|nr:DNA photolyase [Desulfopila inferna]MBM9602867.1 DNA photolyase [Desulfopila inferna]